MAELEIRRWTEGLFVERDRIGPARAEEIPLREHKNGGYVRFDDCVKEVEKARREAYIESSRLMCSGCRDSGAPVSYLGSLVHRYLDGTWTLCDAEAIRNKLNDLSAAPAAEEADQPKEKAS